MTISRRMVDAPPDVRAANFCRHAKLTAADVREIRASSEPQKVVATRFGVSVNTVSMIRRRTRWRYV